MLQRYFSSAYDMAVVHGFHVLPPCRPPVAASVAARAAVKSRLPEAQKRGGPSRRVVQPRPPPGPFVRSPSALAIVAISNVKPQKPRQRAAGSRVFKYPSPRQDTLDGPRPILFSPVS